MLQLFCSLSCLLYSRSLGITTAIAPAPGSPARQKVAVGPESCRTPLGVLFAASAPMENF